VAKAPKLLTLVVLPPADEWPEVAKLAAQGHRILSLAEAESIPLTEIDGFLGPLCWRLGEQHRKYLPVAVQALRRIKYPPKKGEAEVD
jgi:hypothetical protein